MTTDAVSTSGVAGWNFVSLIKHLVMVHTSMLPLTVTCSCVCLAFSMEYRPQMLTKATERVASKGKCGKRAYLAGEILT